MLVTAAVIAIMSISLGAASYDPQATYNYAQKYAYIAVSDGHFYDKNGTAVHIPAGTPIINDGLDCAHFVSSAIGNEQHERGGGIDVGSSTAAPYGNPSTKGLTEWLINNNLAIEVSDILQLEKGDIIIYDWAINTLTPLDGIYDHTTLYLGNGMIASHTTSLWNSDWKMGDANANHKFYHIKGNPTNEWEFNTPGIKEGWFVHNIKSWSVESDGRFRIDPDINDPYIESPSISVSANNFNTIAIRMSSNAPDQNGAIYFKTSTSPEFSEDKKVVFSVITGPNWYDYSILMTPNPRWTGTITGIRVDPSDTGRTDDSDAIGFDYIRLKSIAPTQSDTEKPKVNSMSAAPSSVSLGKQVTVSYSVQDNTALKQVELWYMAPGGSWNPVETKLISGTSVSGSFSPHTPSIAGTNYYGIHVVDTSGNWDSEGSAGPKTVEVIRSSIIKPNSLVINIQDVTNAKPLKNATMRITYDNNLYGRAYGVTLANAKNKSSISDKEGMTDIFFKDNEEEGYVYIHVKKATAPWNSCLSYNTDNKIWECKLPIIGPQIMATKNTHIDKGDGGPAYARLGWTKIKNDEKCVSTGKVAINMMCYTDKNFSTLIKDFHDKNPAIFRPFRIEKYLKQANINDYDILNNLKDGAVRFSKDNIPIPLPVLTAIMSQETGCNWKTRGSCSGSQWELYFGQYRTLVTFDGGIGAMQLTGATALSGASLLGVQPDNGLGNLSGDFRNNTIAGAGILNSKFIAFTPTLDRKKILNWGTAIWRYNGNEKYLKLVKAKKIPFYQYSGKYIEDDSVFSHNSTYVTLGQIWGTSCNINDKGSWECG